MRNVPSPHSLTQHEGVVDGAANAVGKEEDPQPGQVLHHKEGQKLEAHQAQHPPLHVRVIAKQFLDLWVFLCVGEAAFLGICQCVSRKINTYKNFWFSLPNVNIRELINLSSVNKYSSNDQ